MLRAAFARRGLGAKSSKPHELHQSTDPEPSHIVSQFTELIAQLSLSVKGTFHVDFIDQTDQLSITAVHLSKAYFATVPVHAKQLALAANRQLGVLFLDDGFSLRAIPSCSHFSPGSLSQ